MNEQYVKEYTRLGQEAIKQAKSIKEKYSATGGRKDVELAERAIAVIEDEIEFIKSGRYEQNPDSGHAPQRFISDFDWGNSEAALKYQDAVAEMARYREKYLKPEK